MDTFAWDPKVSPVNHISFVFLIFFVLQIKSLNVIIKHDLLQILI